MTTEAGTKKKKRKKKRGRGRPGYVPSAADKATVSALAGFGLGVKKIAGYMKLSAPTIRKHFADELTRSRISVMGKAMSGLVAHLNKEAEWAIKHVFGTLGKDFGWTQRHEITGPQGGAIPVRFSSLSDDQLAQFIRRTQTSIDTTPDED